MPARALVLDGDGGFAETLRGWLADYGLEVAVSADWREGLATGFAPDIVFLGIDSPEEAGSSCCERVKAAWPGARIVLATSAGPLGGVDSGEAHAAVDRATLTPHELYAALAALIGPQAGRTAGSDTSDGAASARVAELEEELRRLRWELEETRSAAQAGPHSRGLLKLSAVVGSKEKELVRLKREIAARDHKVATSNRIAREASARALVATRERDAATSHEAQLQRDLEAEQAEARRLRLEAEHQATETERALASLSAERERHEETRRRHQASLVAQAEALRQLKEDEKRARSALEARLREESCEALAEAVAESDARLERLLRKRARARAARRQERESRSAQHAAELRRVAEERAAALAEVEARAAEAAAAARAAAAKQRQELQRLHDLALAEALAAHADAERRAERERTDRAATETRLLEEKAQAVGAVVAEWEGKLDGLRRAHAESVEALRRHFQDQLSGAHASQEQERARREAESEGALQRLSQELAAARTQAAHLESETRQRHEEELARVEARRLESLAAAESQLRDEKAQAVAAAVAEWEARLEELRRAHAESAEALRRCAAEELAATQAQAPRLEQELRAGFEQELARVEGRHLESLTTLEARLRAERDEAVAATVAAWEGGLQELRDTQSASLDAVGGQYRDELASLRGTHERAIAEREAAHAAALASVAQERAAERAELQRLQEHSLQEALARHFEAERRERVDHQSALVALEQRLRREAAEAVAATVAEWEGRLDELRRAHQGALAALRRDFHDELAQLRASEAEDLASREALHQAALRHAADELVAARTQAARLDRETREGYERELVQVESEHAQAVSSLEASLRGEADEAVAAAVMAWQSRLEELRSAHATAMSGLRREHLDEIAEQRAAHQRELVRRDEEHEAELRRVHEELAAAQRKAVQPGPAQLVARHAEAVSALEARLTQEKEQAVAATAAEWKARVERLRRGHADALAALRHEHEEQLLALDNVRQERSGERAASEPGARVVPLKAVKRDRSG